MADNSCIHKEAAMHLFGKNYPIWVKWRKALRSGNRDVVPKGYSLEQLRELVGLTQDCSLLYKPFKSNLYNIGAMFDTPIKDNACAARSTTACGHRVHPGLPSMIMEHCPLCHANQSISMLSKITELWEGLGGPWQPSLPEGVSVTFYQDLRDLWRIEKIWWAKLLEKYQRAAAMEQAQENIHGKPGDLVNTAQLAARILIQESPYMTGGADQTFVSKRQRCAAIQGKSALPLISTSQTFRASGTATHDEETISGAQSTSHTATHQIRKKVAFSDDVFKPAARSNELYCRRSAYYEPGKYACPTESGWLNTSFAGDQVYDAWVEKCLMMHTMLGEPLPEYRPEGEGDEDACPEEESDEDTTEGNNGDDSVCNGDDKGDSKITNYSKSEVDDDPDMEGLEGLDEVELDEYIIVDPDDGLTLGHTLSTHGRRSREEYEESADDDSSSFEEESEVEVKRRRT